MSEYQVANREEAEEIGRVLRNARFKATIMSDFDGSWWIDTDAHRDAFVEHIEFYRRHLLTDEQRPTRKSHGTDYKDEPAIEDIKNAIQILEFAIAADSIGIEDVRAVILRLRKAIRKM